MKEQERTTDNFPFDDMPKRDDAVAHADDVRADGAEGGAKPEGETGGQTVEDRRKGVGKADTLRRLKEQVREDDEVGAGTLTLRQIVGGDYLLALVRHYVWFIVLVVLLTCVYVGVRYQCQQDVIEISRLEKELVDAKYRAMSSSSNLTEMCRQSNVLKVLGENEDNKLTLPEQPPYIITVEE